jgi:hypothetical protein
MSKAALGIAALSCALVAPIAAQPGKVRGTLTIDGVSTTLSHAILSTRPNPFNDFFQDKVIILSDRPVTADEAANDQALLAKAMRGELVTMAVRFDGRPRRGQLFNVAFNHKGLSETALLPDVWFKYTFKGGAGTVKLETHEFTGRMYSAEAEFSVPVPAETTRRPPAGPKEPRRVRHCRRQAKPTLTAREQRRS